MVICLTYYASLALQPPFLQNLMNYPIVSAGLVMAPRGLGTMGAMLLVRQRPDIQAAEAQLHSASAEIGVATANLYPQITLSAGYTASSLNGSDLFSPGGAVWSSAGSLMQPLFDGGSRRANRREAVANFQASAADYRQTVLQAFAQVGDSLTAIDHDTALQAELSPSSVVLFRFAINSPP